MKISFSTDNDIFKNPITGEDDHFYCKQECIRILEVVKEQIFEGKDYGIILDINGNEIGAWSL
jgi:hypothetical protein